ncbi:MAG: hypothetical protein ABI579_05565 [Candidatus Sumerlaeota bacterium]
MRDLRFSEVLGLFRGLTREYRFLKRAPQMSREEMQAWQFQRIQELVAHAYENVPFYRDLYDSVSFRPGDLKTWQDFARLPIVTKDQVIQNYPDRMLAREVNRDDLVISRSSGSSGKVLDIAYDSKAMTTYILAGLRLYRMGFSYRPRHKQLYVYTSPYPMNSLMGLYPMVFVSTLAPIREIIDAIVREKPDLLVCYPSHLKQILQEMTPADRNALHLKFVSVNSEMSTQRERDDMAEFLRCPVLDEYSSEELTRIAAQCTAKNYHVFEDINFMEIVDADETGLGTLIGTNLHNTAMPMIRYAQNDLGRIGDFQCACGWKFRRLSGLEGRRNDSFLLPSGKLLNSGFLLDTTYEFLLEHRTAVRDFCLMQKASDLIVLEIVPGDGWSEKISAQIQSGFRRFLEDGVTFKIEEVEVCTKTKSGKRNPIINLMNRPKTTANA